MDYTIIVDVSVNNYHGGGNLRLSEQVTIPDCTFADMAEILQAFHQVTEAIKKAKETKRS